MHQNFYRILAETIPRVESDLDSMLESNSRLMPVKTLSEMIPTPKHIAQIIRSHLTKKIDLVNLVTRSRSDDPARKLAMGLNVNLDY